MEKLVISLSTEHYESEKDVRRLIAYIAGKGSNIEKEKVHEVGAHGLRNDYKKCINQLLRVFRSPNFHNSRKMYHIVVSFPKNIQSCYLVSKSAEAIADFIWNEMGHQLFYGIHTSTDNLHIHFGICAINLNTGKKWHQNKKELALFKKTILGLVNNVLGMNCQESLDI